MRTSRFILAALLISITLSATTVVPASVERLTVESTHVVLAQAVVAGMAKINVGTALNLAYTGEVRRRLAEDMSMSDPRKYLRDARQAMAGTVATLITLVSTSNGTGPTADG